MSPPHIAHRTGPATYRFLWVVGVLLFLFSIGFAAQFVARHWSSSAMTLDIGGGTLVAAAALYALTHISSAAAWVAGLRAMRHTVPYASGVRINLVAQIGKYLPGNVAHYFGRAALAMPEGLRLASSGLATLVEIFATLVAAGATAAVALSLDAAPIAAIDTALADRWAVPVVLGGGAVAVIAFLLYWMKIPARAVFAASIWLVGSFLLIGLSFHLLVAALTPVTLSPSATIGIFAVAWAVGYVVPGAPAGLGVREAVLMAWLGPLIGASAGIACVLLHRVLTAIVDGLAALAGLIWIRWGRDGE